jgi:ribonucleotide reductase alpha subunit
MDQALSRNMYLETRDIGEMMDIYSTAWKKGVKTTYYLHMKPRHTAEQSTVHVNKAEQMGKRGFAAVMEAAAEAPAPAEQITVADAISASSESVAESSVNTVPAVAAFGFTATTTPEIVTAEAHTTTPIEITAAKAAPGPFAALKAELPAEPEAQASVAASAAPTTGAPRIMPPSDPQEQFICDSCQ